MNVDQSQNYLVWDNTHAVTVTLKRTGGNTAVSVAIAMDDALNRTDADFLGVGLDSQAINWHIPDALLNPAANGRIIKKGDLITQTGGPVYSVMSSAYNNETCHWKCACVPQR